MDLLSNTSVADYLWKVSWQAGALALLVWIVTRLAKKAPARLRHALWTLVLIKFLVPPFVHLPAKVAVWQKLDESPSSSTTAPVTSQKQVSGGTPVAKDMSPNPIIAAPVTAESPVERQMPSSTDIAASVWIAGMVIMAAVLVLRRIQQAKLIRSSHPVGVELIERLQKTCERMQVNSRVELMCSEQVSTPVLVGLRRPTILIPPGLTDSCTPTDLDAMLLHELAHVKRRDMVFVWLHQLVQTIFFFHPAVWIAGKSLKHERELACDELVLSKSGIERSKYAAGYISALKMANSASRIPVSLGMAEPFEVEKRRLEKIMSYRVKRLSIGGIIGLIILSTAGLATFAWHEKTAEEVLAQMKVERAKAQATIKSGKYSYTTNSSPLPDVDLNCYKSRIDIVFSGIKFKETRLSNIRRKGASKEIVTKSITTYDGKTWIQYQPEHKSGFQRDISPTDTEEYRFALVNQTHPDIQTPPNSMETDLRIVGKERIDSSECIILQFTYVSNQKDKTSLKWLRKLWVAPSKCYSPVKMQNWTEDNSTGKTRLASEVRSKLREYNGLWLPESVSFDVYKEDAKGKTYRYMYSKTTYSPDFKINVPVTDSDLKINLPANAKIIKFDPTKPATQLPKR